MQESEQVSGGIDKKLRKGPHSNNAILRIPGSDLSSHYAACNGLQLWNPLRCRELSDERRSQQS